MASNDEWGDIFNGEPENTSTEKANTGNNEEKENVKPVKLGRMATAGIVVALLVVVLIAIITIRGCTIEKEQNSNQTQGTTISVSAEQPEGTKKPNEVATENSDFNSKNVESDTSRTENLTSAPASNPNGNTAEKSENVEGSGNSKTTDGGLSEVVEPALNNPSTTRGIVVGKHSYLYKGSYVYGVSLSILIGDEARTVQYFCPKKTYDALKSTDALTVSYQEDSVGTVSVISISK